MISHSLILSLLIISIFITNHSLPCASHDTEAAYPHPKPNACWKDAYDRSPGTKPNSDGKCESDKEKSYGLCYKPCKKGTKGYGPFCYQECKDPYPSDGKIMCCNTSDTCKKHMDDLTKALPQAIYNAIVDTSKGAPASKVIKDIREIVKDVLELDFPLCDENILSNPDVESDATDDDNDDSNKEELEEEEEETGFLRSTTE